MLVVPFASVLVLAMGLMMLAGGLLGGWVRRRRDGAVTVPPRSLDSESAVAQAGFTNQGPIVGG